MTPTATDAQPFDSETHVRTRLLVANCVSRAGLVCLSRAALQITFPVFGSLAPALVVRSLWLRRRDV